MIKPDINAVPKLKQRHRCKASVAHDCLVSQSGPAKKALFVRENVGDGKHVGCAELTGTLAKKSNATLEHCSQP